MLTDPKALRARLKTLQKRAGNPGNRHSSEYVEALAEGCFRLAMHPSTPPAEAVDLLHRALRLDGANPKFYYHLARLHFVVGQFEQAGYWLKVSQNRIPTSHRIWVHIALLQKELNAVYRGDSKYEPDALLHRSDEIIQAVRAGHDDLKPELLDFVPPRSRASIEEETRANRGRTAEPTQSTPNAPAEAARRVSVKRLFDTGKCRWSGVNELTAETLLQGTARSTNRDKLMELLTENVQLARLRYGGAAAFAILGIQWIIAGYPVKPVEKLRAEHFPDQNTPALQLLDRVCKLYHISEVELPKALATALDSAELPPLLAAFIHQRRLLWAPYDFQGFTSYRQACSLLRRIEAQSPAIPPTDDQINAATEIAKRLTNALSAFAVPERPAPVVFDRKRAPADAGDDDQHALLETLHDRVEEIGAQLEEQWQRLRQLLDKHKSGGLSDEEKREGAGLKASVESAFTACDEDLRTVQDLREGSAVHQEDLGVVENTERLLRDQITRRGPFARNFRQLPAPTEPVAVAEETATALPPRQLTGVELLQAQVSETQQMIGKVFTDAQATFAPYSASARRSPPIRALRLNLLAREAETYFRIGWRNTARRLWNAMAIEERLDANVMKNIALCDSYAADLQTPSSAWRNYAELLYLYDIVDGNLRLHAAERATFHRAISEAYGPAGLQGELNEDWIANLDRRAFGVFFASPGRVRNFVEHKLLEFLNRKLDFKSPLLIIGVTRSEGVRVDSANKKDDAVRRKAAQNAPSVNKLNEFSKRALVCLPDNVRDGFQGVCNYYFEHAALICTDAERVSSRRDRDYAVEESRQQEWVKDIIGLKYKFTIVLNDEDFLLELARTMSTVAWLRALQLLDLIPLDLSPALAQAAALSLRLADMDGLNTLMIKRFTEYVLITLLQFIFVGDNPKRKPTKEEATATEMARKRQYHALVTEWVNDDALSSYRELIDDPQMFYRPSIEGLQPAQMIEPLKQFHDQYPELTGPARILVALLTRFGRLDEAMTVVDEVLEKSFYTEAHPNLHFLKMQVWYGRAQAAAQMKDHELVEEHLTQIRAEADIVLTTSSDSELMKPTEEMLTLGIAQIAYAQDRYQACLDLLADVNPVDFDEDTSAQMCLLLGVCHFHIAAQQNKDKEFESALESLQTALVQFDESLKYKSTGETADQAKRKRNDAQESLEVVRQNAIRG